MRRSIISILLSTIFVALLVAPTIILIVDDSIDVSAFYASSEEEEEKGIEKSKDKEVFFSDYSITESDFVLNETKSYIQYYFKKYSKPHLNLISPPPELHIL